MKFGIYTFQTDTMMAVDELAKAAEDRGFDSFWVCESVHVLASSPPPPEHLDAAKVPGWRQYDPFVSLTWAAAATSELKIGTAVCQVPLRDVIVTAKQVASLDRLSGGRFLFGIGAVGAPPELEALRMAWADRWKITEEKIKAMQALWDNDAAEFHGKYVDFPETKVWPKPVQSPHPPILIGADSTWARQRVVDWADGWLPAGTQMDAQSIAAGTNDLRQRAEKAGRDPDSLDISIASGKISELDAYEKAGVTRCVYWLPSEGADVLIPLLDEFARSMKGHT